MRWRLGIGAVTVLWASMALAQAPEPMRRPQEPMRDMPAKQMGMQKQLPHKAPQAVIDKLTARAREYEQAYNQHDVEKLASFYTQEASILSPMEAVAGRKQIEESLRTEHSGPMRDARVSFTVQSIRAITPDVAIMDLQQRMQGMQAPKAGEAAMPEQMHVTVVAVKKGESWLADSVRVYPMMMPGMGVGGAGEQMPAEEHKAPGTGGSGMEQQPKPQRQPQPSPY